jgi:hypothetical protein
VAGGFGRQGEEPTHVLGYGFQPRGKLGLDGLRA